MWKKCRHCGKGDFSSAPRTPNLRLETDNASSTHEKPWNAYRENLSLADAFESLKQLDYQLTYLVTCNEKQTQAVNHSEMQIYDFAVN